MPLKKLAKQHPTRDGDGVNIARIAAFHDLGLDPYLMIDEIQSDDESDYIGGFPPHPHRGIETFTYIKKGGFEHRDQMGNVKAIRAGDVQWMSTGRGVIHSEMPLADATDGMHGFQIWLNMPASEKMRDPRYFDSYDNGLPILALSQSSHAKALAGSWIFNDQTLQSPLQGLAGHGAIADIELAAGEQVEVLLEEASRTLVFCYQGSLGSPQLSDGELAVAEADGDQRIRFCAGPNGAELLLLRGRPINEKIVHMGPFVMNTQAEIEQAIMDYRAGRFGTI
jgi:quercetin 2,3-dioxygenase